MTTNDNSFYAETSLAGVLLTKPECIRAVPGYLQHMDFLSDTCRTVFQAACDLARQRKAIDPVTIQEWAAQKKQPLDPNVVQELMHLSTHAESVEDYARIVHDSALRRALQAVGQQLANSNAEPLPELITRGMRGLQNIQTYTQSGSVSFQDVPSEEVRWLLKPYIPIGKGTLIQADPGTGKTAFVCALAAAVSTGRSILGLPISEPGNVIMVSIEDDPGALRARLEADGADLNRIFLMKYDSDLTFRSARIEQEILLHQAKLVVFDPLQAFLGSKVDFFRANETRPILAQLFDMCQRNGCACIIIAHLSKSVQGKSAVVQSLGSVDIPGAMRSILHIARNENLPGELAAVHVKSNCAAKGKTICFSIGDRGGVEFHDLNDLELKELQQSNSEDPSLSYEKEPLVEILNALIAQYPQGGFWSYEAIQECFRSKYGSSIYQSNRVLRSRLEALKPDLLARDGLLMMVGQRCKNDRGIRLTRFENPQGRQEQLPMERRR